MAKYITYIEPMHRRKKKLIEIISTSPKPYHDWELGAAYRHFLISSLNLYTSHADPHKLTQIYLKSLDHFRIVFAKQTRLDEVAEIFKENQLRNDRERLTTEIIDVEPDHRERQKRYLLKFGRPHWADDVNLDDIDLD